MNSQFLIILSLGFYLACGQVIQEKEIHLSKDQNKNIDHNNARLITPGLCYCRDLRINCDLKTVCASDCRNATRYAEEVDCVFPFQYKGVWYDTCTDIDNPGQFWCSVDKIFDNKFALCEQKCPYLARTLVGSGDTHTSCKPSAAGFVPKLPTDAEIQTILDLHNYERQIVNPTASDMKLLTWDQDLARLAMNLAMTGVMQHDCGNCRRLINKKNIYNGQNLYASSGATYSTLQWGYAVRAWNNEKKDWKYGNGSINGGVVGHYTQVVYSGSVRVGCGGSYNEATKTIIIGCNYASGQFSFSTPYTLGTPCTNCPSCFNSTICQCNKLCDNGGTLDTNTCTCKCLPYATGAECETLLCDKTDQDYGCWSPGNTDNCRYTNTKPLCPHTCGTCTFS